MKSLYSFIITPYKERYNNEINVGDNFRINKPLTSRIAYSAIIDVITMGVAQLKPEAQEHLYNIVDSQRSLKIK